MYLTFLGLFLKYIVMEEKILFFCDAKGIEPRKATIGSAAFDVFLPEDLQINLMQLKTIDTGVKFKMPPNHLGLLTVRSSAAMKGVILLGGLLDSDFTQNIKLLLSSIAVGPLHFTAGESVAQISFIPISTVSLARAQHAHDIPDTVHKGFGSTSEKPILLSD